MSCSICNNKVRAAGIDAALDRGLSAAAVARDQTETGWPVTDATIRRHREHYQAPAKIAPGKTQKDLAILLRDRAVEMFEDEELDLANKEHVPGLALGLRAQDTLDKRLNRTDDKKALLAVAIALIGGTVPTEMLGLDDGLTIDGEAVDID